MSTEAAIKAIAIIQANLGTELGTLQNGQPAIWREPPQMPPAGTGLHVIVSRYQQQLSKSVYQQTITLIQYDRSPAGLLKLDAAIQKIRQLFSDRRESIPPFREAVYPQAIFQVNCYQSSAAPTPSLSY